MPNTPTTQTRTPTLSDTMLASAQNVQSVLAGRSLSDSLAATPPAVRASAQSVSFHVMRHLGMARAIKRILVRRTPPNPGFDALLLVSLALLDAALEYAEDATPDPARWRHVPLYAVHTVVDQAVGAASGQHKMRAYKGLLNATLRGFIRERSAILAQVRENPEAMFNHPAWWVARIRRSYPGHWEALLAAANVPGPLTLRVNVRRSSVPHMLAALQAADIPAVHAGNEAIVLLEARPVQAVPGFNEGWWSVQDLAAQQAARLLPLKAGMRVLDACAAPGGKTAHLLERADVDLLALDADPARLARIEQNLQRLGLDGMSVSVHCADAADVQSWWDGRPFDAILADVPCTASGVVRRHPDIRWLRREADIAKTAALQRDIVDALWITVGPGGYLLYATCSIFPQEGEQQATEFARRHPDAIRQTAPGQLLPLASDPVATHDGFFYALFAKRA